MADTKISALTDGSPAQASDQIPINRAGLNFRINAGTVGGPTSFIGSPTGSCTALQTAIDTTTGNFWDCNGTTWNKVGPAAATLSSPITSPSPLVFDVTATFKGPSPWVDVTTFGARGLGGGETIGAPGFTATINGGSHSASLSSAGTFQNGDGVVIWGAGPAITMSTPGAPTVTPAIPTSGTNTGNITSAPSGSNTYNYQIVARDQAGGLTAASPVGTTTTGPASLGVQSVGITSISKSGRINTVTTASAHGFNVGCNSGSCGMVLIQGTSDETDFSGWVQIATVPDNTHLTYGNGMDSLNGAGTSATGGTINWWNCNHLTWTSVAGAFAYYIYGRTGGSLTLLGVSKPVGANDSGLSLVWDDFGSTMMQNFTAPYYVPNTPPSTALADPLTTTIASGAGTTTLSLTAAATTSVTSATILFDNAAPMANAAAYTRSNGSFMYIPPDISFLLNSVLVIPAYTAIVQSGNLSLNDTMVVNSNIKWTGLLTPSSIASPPSFGFSGFPGVQTLRATPGVYFGQNIASITVSGLNFSTAQSNNALLTVFDGAQESTFTWLNFQTNSATDYMGIHMLFYGLLTNSSFFNSFNYITFISPQWSSIQQATPAFYCNICGLTEMKHLSLSSRGIAFGIVQDLQIEWGREQAGSTAFLTIGGIPGQGGGYASVSHFELDTMSMPLVSHLAGNTTGVIANATLVVNDAGFPSTNGFGVFGNSTGTAFGNAQGVVGQNTFVGGASASGDAVSIRSFGTSAIGMGMSKPVAPTIVVGAHGSCVSQCVPAGTYFYAYAPMDVAGHAGPTSPVSASATTDGTQSITLSYPAPQGAVGVAPGRGTTVNNILFNTSFNCAQAGTTGYVDNSTLSYGTSSPCIGAGVTAQTTGIAAGANASGLTGSILTYAPTFFASLGTPINGTVVYCADCTIANPCAGSGTGALAKRLNGVWVCN